jgi:RWP-RK domain
MSQNDGGHVEKKSKSGRRAAHSSLITFEDLAKFFHLPITKVAGELGVCTTVLKKVCRRNGIPRWPHRKLRAIDKMIDLAEKKLSRKIASQGARAQLELEIEQLREKRANIMQNPSVLHANRQRFGIAVATRSSSATMPLPSLAEQQRARRRRVGGGANTPFDMSTPSTAVAAVDDDLETLEAAKILGNMMQWSERTLDSLDAGANVPAHVYHASSAPPGSPMPTLVFNQNVRPRTEVRQPLQQAPGLSAFEPSSSSANHEVVGIEYGTASRPARAAVANTRALLPRMIQHHHHLYATATVSHYQ